MKRLTVETINPEFLAEKTCGERTTLEILRYEVAYNVHSGNYDRAVSLLELLIYQNPDSAIDYNNRGYVYLKLGNLSAAILDLEQAIELDPLLDRAHNNRGNCSALAGNLPEALEHYNTAICLNSNNGRAWINQGITLRDMGLYELAVTSFDYPLQVQHLQSHTYAERGRTHHLAGDWNWAVADYQLALASLTPIEKESRETYAVKRRVQRWINSLLFAY